MKHRGPAQAVPCGSCLQNAPPRDTAAGIDRQHGNPVVGGGEMAPERFDKCALARARDSGDPHAQGTAGKRQELCEHPLGNGCVRGGIALYERDRPPENNAITGSHAGDVLHRQ